VKESHLKYSSKKIKYVVILLRMHTKDTSNAALKEGAISAAIGAALGAAAGAVIQGGSSQNIGTGAGVGLLGGAAMGAMNSAGKQNQAQTQYNIAYQQCMYSKGNQVPSYPSPVSGPSYR
jgi:hypothetical protein